MADNSSGRDSRNGKADVDSVERKIEQWGTRVGRFVASAAARTKEEAEDIWAEAQSIRKGERK